MFKNRMLKAGVILSFLIFSVVLLLPQNAVSGSRELVSGPFSVTLRGGGQSDSGSNWC